MSFLGIKIPHETARLLSLLDVPGDKEDSNSLHITLLYLGENIPIKTIAKAMIATYEVTNKTTPFLLKTNNVTCFPKNDKDVVPIISQIQSPKLMELNENLKSAFDKANIEYSKKFKEYKPHITLSYSDEEIKKQKIDAIEFGAQELVLFGGDHGDEKVFITFPFSLKQVKKAARLSLPELYATQLK